jgi:hypothetical protein
MLVHKRLSKKDVFCRECLAPILLSNFVKQPHQKFAFSFCNLFTEVKRTLTSNTVFGDKTLVTYPLHKKRKGRRNTAVLIPNVVHTLIPQWERQSIFFFYNTSTSIGL